MRWQSLILFALLAVVGSSHAWGKSPTSFPFVIGYNQAWFGEQYRYDLSQKFNLKTVEWTYSQIAKAGGTVVRQWIWKGEKQGVLYATGSTQILGVDPLFLQKIDQVMQIAAKYHLKVYWTLFDSYGVVPGTSGSADRDPLREARHRNLMNNENGELDIFLQKVLLPVLQVLQSNRKSVFAIDLLNEFEATVELGFFKNQWASATDWANHMFAFIHQNLSAIPLSISTGWQNFAKVSGMNLDFYDVHDYDDNAVIFQSQNWCEIAKAKPILLGEFGPSTKKYSDSLQVKNTQFYLNGALQNCFSGALAWRFDDERPSSSGFTPNFSFVRNRLFRPAVATMQKAQSANSQSMFGWPFLH